MHRGWFPAWRKLYSQDHWLSPDKRDPACRRDAWMDICQMAQHQDYEHAGHELKRGEILLSIRTMADRWGWSKSRTSRFIIGLTSVLSSGTPDGPMMEQVSGTPNGTVYRIVNYDTYNPRQSTERDTEEEFDLGLSGTPSGTPAGHQRDKNKNEALKKKPIGGNGRVKIPLPKSWEPNDTHKGLATRLGLDIGREFEMFSGHAEMNGRTLKNWNAGFTHWLKKAQEFSGGRTQKPKSETSHLVSDFS